jgi:RNA polymerase sigma-70 factor (ECF subfamily)
VDDPTWTLVARIRAGDAAALAALYERDSDGVYRYLLLVCGEHTLAEDLTEQAFRRLRHQSGSPSHPRSTVRAELYCAAYSLLQGHRRPAPTVTELDRPEPPGDGAAPAAGGEPGGFWDPLPAALARLADLSIQVLALKIGGGLSNAEIARVLDCHEGEIKHAQLAGLAQLRQWLAGAPPSLSPEEIG